MENQTPDEQPQGEESFLKPKVRVKRNITDEQRLILAERMRAINDKRIADAMAKKKDLETAKIEAPEKSKEAPVKSKEAKPRKVIKVVEVSEPETDSESESEEEVQYVVVPKKSVAKKEPAKKPAKKAPAKKATPKPVYESEDEEDEAPKTILKQPRKQKASSQPPAPEAPKILFRFL